MNQRTLLSIAAALTAFVLVFVGGLAAFFTQQPTLTPKAAPTVAIQQAAPSAASTPLSAANTPQPITPIAGTVYKVTAKQAGDTALSAVAGSKLSRDPELVNFQGPAGTTVAYEVQLDKGSVYVDATSGAILQNNAVKITQEQAQQIAVTYAKGGTVSSVTLDQQQGTYNVKFADGSVVNVSETTGQVVYAQMKSAPAQGGDKEGDDKEDGEREGGEREGGEREGGEREGGEREGDDD